MLRARFVTAIVLFPVGMIACSAPPPPAPEPELGSASAPLIGGTVDIADPGVVALSLDSHSAFCTGTLISPSIVLTAAHCLDMAGANPNFIAFFGSDVKGDGRRIAVKTTQQHPQWNGNAGQFDVGLIRLAFAQDPKLAVPLNTTEITADIGVTDAYRHVGFGISQRNAGGGLADADGKKRTGSTTINSSAGDLIVHGDAETTVCFGDSGGPGFLLRNGVEQVAGIHSTTSSDQCGQPNSDTRVDLYVQSFILPYVEENDPVCGDDGNVCAKVGCQADPDCQPCGPDGTCTADCPLPDRDCPTSALGEICQATSQCMAGTCIFLEEDPDFKFCTQACDPGGDDCPSGMSCTNRPGFGDVCDYDRPPHGVLGDSCKQATECGSYTCLESTCVKRCDLSQGLTCGSDFECREPGQPDSRFYCFPKEKGGGCQAGSSAGTSAWPLLAAAIALACRRRRRRS